MVKREGLERYFDLPERAIPADLLERARALSAAEADALMLEKYLRAYRVFDAGDSRFGWRAMTASARREAVRRRVRRGAIIPLIIDGVGRQYFVRAEDLPALRRHARDDGPKPARGDDGAHRCEEERLLDYLLLQHRDVIAGFDGELGDWLDSAAGRFAAWLAERER